MSLSEPRGLPLSDRDVVPEIATRHFEEQPLRVKSRPYRLGLFVRLFHDLTFVIAHTELAPTRFRNFWR